LCELRQQIPSIEFRFQNVGIINNLDSVKINFYINMTREKREGLWIRTEGKGIETLTVSNKLRVLLHD